MKTLTPLLYNVGMIIYDITEKGKNMILGSLIIILGALGLWGAYKLMKVEQGKVPITIEYATSTATVVQKVAETQQKTKDKVQLMKYVASHGGVSYYPIDCPAGKKIATKNKVFFPTSEIAEMAGYKPSKKCK